MASGQHMRFQPMKSNAMSHNHRLKVPSYVVSEKTELNVVYVQTSKRNLTDYTKAVKADYENHHGQKYQDKMNPLWETLIVVNPETTDEAIREAIKLIERETGLKIVDAVRHKDEGHFKGDEWIPNEHVHLIAERYNFETHKHVTLDVKQIRDLRLKVAGTLGIAYTQTKEGEKPKKNVSHHKFREEAQKGQIIDLSAENAKMAYNFREAQKRITALEGIDAEHKKELHRLNTEINKIKIEGATKDLKISELEAKLTEAVKVPHEPEGRAERVGNAIEGYLETLPKSTGVSVKSTELDEVSFYGQAGERAAKYSRGEEYAAELVKKHTGLMGKVDKDALIAELGQEFKGASSIMYKGLSLVEDFKLGFDTAKRGFESALKRTETALKDVFSKNWGKSFDQVKNERTEHERAQKAELVKQKEAEQPFELKRPSRGLSL